MRAAIYNGPGRPITVEKITDPNPGPDGLVIEVGYCGICGSDVAQTSGGLFDHPIGHCFGHEYAGTVVELGHDVTGWKIGARVACMPKVGCGNCDICLAGRPLLCPGGKKLAAGFAEFIAVPASAAVPLPETLSLADGALIEPMACGLRALRAAQMRRGDRILVVGAGAVALSAIWWARRLGAASVVGASRSTSRREIVRQFGADELFAMHDATPGDLADALGGRPDIIVECAGKAGALSWALDQARPGSTVVSMGMSMNPESILPAKLNFNELRIIFPIGWSVQEFEQTAYAFDREGFRPRLMVSDVMPLEGLDSAMTSIRQGSGTHKVHIDPRLRP